MTIRFLQSLAVCLLEAVMEQRCTVCGVPCPGVHTESVLCQSCRESLKPLEKGSFCPWCGEILPKRDARRFFCEPCTRHPPPWQEIHLLGCYENRLRELLTGLKFHGHLWAAHLVGTLLAASMPASFGDTPFLLVPVPLSLKRLRKRGFNQALELVKPVARKFSLELDGTALLRYRDTAPQSELPESVRRANIRGAFRAAPKKIADRHIILCDDIMTTGSTLREAAETLEKAGAKSISILVAARTPRHFASAPAP